MINGVIAGGYPPSTVDITADKKFLKNKFADNLFDHQIYLVNRDVKHLFFCINVKMGGSVSCSQKYFTKNSNTINHIFIASIQKVNNENGITDLIWKSWKEQV